MSSRICAVTALCFVAACSAPPPNDVAEGVGFGDYAAYQQRQATARASAITAPRVPQPETVLPPSAANDPLILGASRAIAEAEAGAGTVPPRSAAPTPTQTQVAAASNTGAETPIASLGNPSMSDEQDFDAVAARETIESDAERLRRMQEQMVIVQPTDLPDRPASSGPNIIEYALSTTHPVGQQVYRRSRLGAGRHEQNCLSYQSDDLAQQAFLAAGGPDRDRQALDPDGDGYACNWNPNVYRNAARSGRFTGATGTAPGSQPQSQALGN